MTSCYPEKRLYKKNNPVLSHLYKIILFGASALLPFFISCTEEATTIGSNLLPSSDFENIRSTDTMAVYSYTEYSDSIVTNNKTYSYLGGLYDPYFGNISTDFVAQLRLLDKFKGGDPFTVDSVKLFMKIVGAKGAVQNRHYLDMWEIDEYLSKDSSYYSNRDARSGKYLGYFPMAAAEKDTIVYMTVNLSKEVGEYLTRDTNMLFQDEPESDFRSFFKGIHLSIRPIVETKASSSKGNEDVALLALSFTAGNFVLRVYYSTPDTSKTYDFIINKNSVRYNRYFHDYSTADPARKIPHIGDGYRDTMSYQQGYNGVYTRITIPGLAKYRDSSNMSVNKARLSIPVFLDDDVYTSSTVATKIYLRYKDSDSTQSVVPDYLLSSSFFGGSFSSTAKNFTFNLASFAQEYIDGNIPYPEFYMYFTETEYRNTILKANGATTPVKFEFVYTRY